MKKIEKQNIEKTSLNLKKFIKYIFITIALMWIGNILGQSITMILGSFMQHNISNPIQTLLTSSDMWLNLVLISIIAPIFEEIIFRKILVDRTIKYGVRVSIIFSATIFTLFHGNLNQFFYAFLMGGFFAYVYAKTGKIEYTIILHMAINFLGSVVSQFAANSMQLVESGTGSIGDIAFSIIFIFIYVFALLITTYTLLKYKKYKFNGLKTQISLKNPIKTMFINYGMICFITFFLIRIFQQILS
ncbi:CPBP family intramembrane glutamic endopeptidase [uncultured Methanobrevibacter sp.]|uniref:CPBP family intramembrane glutamic endopeptidase n=1 Tax=uncultured Methanobrevibacter sp. TaxID=253161 RepID=UPI0025DB26F1|nr:CPBP family intramembrane glutamic endopeptidase [uncultured Methanobrevibacter sp.]